MPLSTVLGAQSLVQPAVCTTATRPASPYTGQAIYDTTTATQLIWNGTAWVGTGGGLVCVKAETAFTTSSSVTADTIFNSTYTNYLLNIRYLTTGSAGGVKLKVRASGSSVSTNYNFISNNGYGSTNTVATTSSTTSATIADNTNTGGYSYTTVNISGIALAEATVITALNSSNYGGATSPQSNFYASNHSTATAYDGIELLVTTGTMTGSYTIYGYSKTV